ncbi:transglycosylase family protein [Spirillospora sp. CA-294931]|uniref:transglycosylase family protein n=1 Tax=Spirillospora sp. CA-294931 TaxID=3240042 RepID=UPI003D94A935
MRRPPTALPALVVVAALAAGCGGSEPKSKAPVADAAQPSASPSASPTPRKVVIVVDKKKITATTTGTTVQQVLDQAKVTLGQYDLVAPPREAPAGDTIKVVRLLSKPVTKTVKFEAPTVKKKSSKLAPFTEKVMRKGKPGLKVVQTAFVKRRGKKVKAVISEKIKRKPVAEILAVGPQSGGGPASGLNWAGLAKCESGGNPRAVNPAGYYGLYQFSMQTWSSVGGKGRPSDASPGEQTYRAQMLYKKVNGRWQGQWPNCGKFLFS